jgi:hypothetical protein
VTFAPLERGIESVINNRYSFDIGLEAAPCALHGAASKDAEQDPLFRATPEAPLLAGLFFDLRKVACGAFREGGFVQRPFRYGHLDFNTSRAVVPERVESS